MPIYVEARNVQDFGGVLGGHMYLVYVPIGEENNYAAWKTIGAFSEISGSVGPWGLLEVRFPGRLFEHPGDDDNRNR